MKNFENAQKKYYIIRKFFVFVLYCSKRRCSEIKPQLKVEIEDGREKPSFYKNPKIAWKSGSHTKRYFHKSPELKNNYCSVGHKNNTVDSFTILKMSPTLMGIFCWVLCINLIRNNSIKYTITKIVNLVQAFLQIFYISYASDLDEA